MMDAYKSMIGCGVRKADGQRFKSNLMVNIIKDVVFVPALDKACFTFVEDDSQVECWLCIQASSPNPLYGGYLNSPDVATTTYVQWLETTLTKSNELLDEWLRVEELRGGEV